jgi:hypothetical protein
VYLIPDLDVCPPVQEDLDGPEVAFLSSIVEGSISLLSYYISVTCVLSVFLKYKYLINHIIPFIHSFILYKV